MVYRIRIFAVIAVIACFKTLYAAGYEEISLEDIFGKYSFYQRSVYGIRSMNDGEHFTMLEGNMTIGKYSYKSGQFIDFVFDIRDIDDREIHSFSDYAFNQEETKILLTTNKQSIYRHSFSADYYIYDIAEKTISALSDLGSQQLADFSPDGKKVAFVRENNLFYVDLESGEEIQITYDGSRNEIINGTPDWVYEEEFSFSKGFHWSPSSDRVAFYRFDERRVKEFNMTIYGDLYPEWYSFKYPKAGEENSIVDIKVYHIDNKKTVNMDIGPVEDQYIPRIKWTFNNDVLSILRLNRLQNHIEVLLADAQTGNSSVVYQEEDEKYISEVNDHFITFTNDGRHFIVMSEKSGYMHLYLHDINGNELHPITSGDFDIAEFIGYDHHSETVYYRSHEPSAIQTDVYNIKLSGKGKRRISENRGTNEAQFSSGYKYFINEYSNANTPKRITLHNNNGRLIRVLEDNSGVQQQMKKHGFSKKVFITVPVNGVELNAWMIKPPDFSPDQEYPLFMFVYGGPESQDVVDEYVSRHAWYQMLAQKGYVIVCVDNRGTDGRGEAFKKATYMQLGKLETEDQVASATYFGALPYIDEERIGIFGWSYGGFMSLLCMTRGDGVFKMGISVAPVTNWRFYDTIYTERFMRTPQENPEGYDDNSPINHADKLTGKLMIVHGMGDDNVHMQNTIEMVEELVQSDKQFDMQLYPNKNHGIYGGNTTMHLFKRMTDFIYENL